MPNLLIWPWFWSGCLEQRQLASLANASMYIVHVFLKDFIRVMMNHLINWFMTLSSVDELFKQKTYLEYHYLHTYVHRVLLSNIIKIYFHHLWSRNGGDQYWNPLGNMQTFEFLNSRKHYINAMNYVNDKVVLSS